MNPGVQARLYVRRKSSAVLSTHSRKFTGYPFGSVTPYVPDHSARPVILISRLAEHTRNIAADPRVSLLIHDAGEDVQAGARLTLVGEAARLADQRAMRERYLRHLPSAERLLALGDFTFYAVAPVALRFIGGFGDIQWVSAESYASPVSHLADDEDAIIGHMNRDHMPDLRNCCRMSLGREADSVQMIGIDCDGFEIRADGTMLRFDFPSPATDALQARAALLHMAHSA